MAQQRIVLLGPAYPYRGGNALFMSHLYEALAPHFEVHFINYTLLYPSLLFPGTTQFDQSQEMTKQIPNERLINSVNPVSWWRTARRIRELKPDLVVFDWWNPFFGPAHRVISTLLGKEYRKKILFITENVISHEARFIDKFLTKFGLANAASFLVLSGQVAEDVKPFAKNIPVYRSELPVFGKFYAQTARNTSKYAAKTKFGYTNDDDVILFFGYIRTYKGLDILLQAMPLIHRTNPRVKLLVAGEFYDERKSYYRLIDELGITESVKMFDSFIPNEFVAEFYAASDVVILPYRSATQSGILGIAYGFDCPVIVSDVGGLAESVEVEKTGLVVPPASPEALANAVQRFYELRATTDFSANVRTKAQSNAFAQIHVLFEEILQK
ncbi:MAG: glycosyltransferase [Candidatus Kapaibacterium sp.]|nr:MAG: glycosyltransferase [Candidatus Kapabacteria bacterium]